MEAGAVAAEELNLEIGVALTAEQMASLTSDIVWLVEENINGQKVLVPEVFLASVRAADLTSDGALIVGGDVAIYSKENIENIGTIKADGTVDLKGENINNLGGRITGENVKLDADKNITNKGGSIRARVDAILKGENVINEANVKESQYKGLNQKTVSNAGSISAGQNLSINAEKDIINKGSVLAADKNLDLNAGENVDIVTVANEKHVGVVCPGSSAEIHSVENQQSVLTGGNMNINAGRDVNIQGGLIAQWTSGDFLAGASGTALLESMQSAIYEIEDPALKQIAAGALGAIAGEIVSGNAQAGASGAISTERDNHLTHEQYEKMLEDLKEAKDALSVKNTLFDNIALSKEQRKEFHKIHENDREAYIDSKGNKIYIPINVGVDISGNEEYLYPGPGEKGFTIDKKLVATDLMKEKINSYDYTSLGAGEIYSVSQSISYGLGTVEICLTITNTGEKYQDIKILGGVDKNFLEKVSQLTKSSFGAAYSEGKSTVYDSQNNVVNDPEKIRDTLTGTSFVAGGTILSANKNASIASNGNMVVSNSESSIGTSGIGGSAGISIGSYLGK